MVADENLVQTVSLGAVEVIVDALRVHKLIRGVQSSGVTALRVLCSAPGVFICPLFMYIAKLCGTSDARSTAVALHAKAYIQEALIRFPTDEALQVHGTYLVAALS